VRYARDLSALANFFWVNLVSKGAAPFINRNEEIIDTGTICDTNYSVVYVTHNLTSYSRGISLTRRGPSQLPPVTFIIIGP
jgi:hypothetical protein